MARQAKKKYKNHVPINKESKADGTRSWPDLPQQLINVMAWQIDLMKDISYGGVTKSWRPHPRNCNNSKTIVQPCLGLYDDGNKDRKYQFNLSFHHGEWFWYPRRPWQRPWKYCVGYSDGVLVFKGESPADYYLDYSCRNLWGGYSHLSEWDSKIPFKRVVISLSSSSTFQQIDFVMVLTGISHPAFVYLRRSKQGEYEWIKQDCPIADPHCFSGSVRRKFMQFTNAIGHNGKFYALSLQGTLVLIEPDIDSHLKITGLGPRRAVPSIPSRHFRECLLESNEEILLALLISRKSVKIVDDVEVFQLDIGTLSWIKMEKLGDRTLVLGANCCMSVSASKLGCRRDCVYFSHHTAEGWWAYDFQIGDISLCRSEEILPQNFTVMIERTRRRVTSVNLYMQE